MYVDPFVCGILFTLLTEFTLALVSAMYKKKGK